MINLIPPRARKSVMREYWIRVVSVWLFLLGTGCLIVAVLLLPTYMMVHGQIVTLDGEVSAKGKTATSYNESATALTEASVKAALLTSRASTTPFSHYLKTLESIAGADIEVRSVEYSNDGITNGRITLAGVAQTREALATFRDTLEAYPAFMAVVLPISALIKDRDLLFSMDITIASSTP